MYDLLFTLHAFDTLPSSLWQFKKEMRDLFPLIYDTKHLSSTLPQIVEGVNYVLIFVVGALLLAVLKCIICFHNMYIQDGALCRYSFRATL